MAFRDELHAIADRVGVDVRILVGTDIGDDQTDQLGIPGVAPPHPRHRGSRRVRLRAARDAQRRAPPSRRTPCARTDRSTTNGSSTDERLTSRGRHSVGHCGSAPALGQLPHQLRVEQPHRRERGRRRCTQRRRRTSRAPLRSAAPTTAGAPPPPTTPPSTATASSAATTVPRHRSLASPSSTAPPPVATAAKATTVDGPVDQHALRRCPGPGRAAGQPLVDVQALQLPSDRSRSRRISEQAAPLLRTEALQAQSREHRHPLGRQLHERGVCRIAAGSSRRGAVLT